MITAKDIVIEIMEDLGFTHLSEDLSMAFGNPKEQIFMHHYLFESPKASSYEISKSIIVSPGGVVVKKLSISDCGRKIKWKHRDKQTVVDLCEPDSIDKILEYAKARD